MLSGRSFSKHIEQGSSQLTPGQSIAGPHGRSAMPSSVAPAGMRWLSLPPMCALSMTTISRLHTNILLQLLFACVRQIQCGKGN